MAFDPEQPLNENRAMIRDFLNNQCYSTYNRNAETVIFAPKSNADTCRMMQVMRMIHSEFGFSCCGRNITVAGESKIKRLEEEAQVVVDRTKTREFLER